MNLKKCFVTVSILFMSTMALADGHSYNVEMMSSCSAYNHSAQMMGELPLQISGSMSCVNYAAEIKGQEVTMSGDCTFGAVVTPASPPMMNWTGTCRNYDADGNSIMMRYTHKFPAGAQSGKGAKVVVLGGTGLYEGVTGDGTADWAQMPVDPNKPMEWKNTVSTKLKIN